MGERPGICEAQLIGGTVQFFRLPVSPDSAAAIYYAPCDQPVTHRISSGCVHEHVRSWDICDDCADAAGDRLAHGGDDGVQCVECRPVHGKCPVIVAIEPLAMAVAL